MNQTRRRPNRAARLRSVPTCDARHHPPDGLAQAQRTRTADVVAVFVVSAAVGKLLDQPELRDRLRRRVTDELSQPKLREPCRKTLQSLLDHWSGLTLFVDDPKIPMDNNASERTVRSPD